MLKAPHDDAYEKLNQRVEEEEEEEEEGVANYLSSFEIDEGGECSC
jgi:hypothetical protein